MITLGRRMRGLSMKIPLLVLLSTLAAALLSCSGDSDITPGNTREFKTKTGKTIIITEIQTVGQSLSTIEINTEGFEHNYPQKYEDVDPISDIFMADLDGNGYDEIYIIITSAGSGSSTGVISTTRPMNGLSR